MTPYFIDATSLAIKYSFFSRRKYLELFNVHKAKCNWGFL